MTLRKRLERMEASALTPRHAHSAALVTEAAHLMYLLPSDLHDVVQAHGAHGLASLVEGYWMHCGKPAAQATAEDALAASRLIWETA